MFVFWEWVRHRIASYNLESSRYKQLEPVFWIPRRTRKLTPTDKHKSARPDFKYLESDDTYNRMISCLKTVAIQAYDVYEILLAHGIAKEVARTCLPNSIYFSGWVTVNPRSLMAFLSLRTHDPDAKFVSFPQAEIEEAARAIEEIFKKGWPLTYKAFCDNGRVAP